MVKLTDPVIYLGFLKQNRFKLRKEWDADSWDGNNSLILWKTSIF